MCIYEGNSRDNKHIFQGTGRAERWGKPVTEWDAQSSNRVHRSKSGKSQKPGSAYKIDSVWVGVFYCCPHPWTVDASLDSVSSAFQCGLTPELAWDFPDLQLWSEAVSLVPLVLRLPAWTEQLLRSLAHLHAGCHHGTFSLWLGKQINKLLPSYNYIYFTSCTSIENSD